MLVQRKHNRTHASMHTNNMDNVPPQHVACITKRSSQVLVHSWCRFVPRFLGHCITVQLINLNSVHPQLGGQSYSSSLSPQRRVQPVPPVASFRSSQPHSTVQLRKSLPPQNPLPILRGAPSSSIFIERFALRLPCTNGHESGADSSPASWVPPSQANL